MNLVFTVLLVAMAMGLAFALRRCDHLEQQLAESVSRSTGLAKEANYWIGRYNDVVGRYKVLRSGLARIRTMRTAQMANIGVRMAKVAVDTLKSDDALLVKGI
jgi:hypothetical protein